MGICTEEQAAAIIDHFDKADKWRADQMPTEQDAIRVFFEAWQRLKEFGWREAIYCPKDGTWFESIEPGSTGIHKTQYTGEWPKGSWWVAEGGDLWPSHPCLFRAAQGKNEVRE